MINKINILGSLLALLSFFAPIALILYIIIFVILLDCFTAIIKAIEEKFDNELCKNYSWFKKIICKLRIIKSSKLRRTILKMFFYLLFVMAVYGAEIAIFGVSVYITNFAAFLIIFAELVSICENMDKSLGTTLFTGVIQTIRKQFENKITDKIENKNNK